MPLCGIGEVPMNFTCRALRLLAGKNLFRRRRRLIARRRSVEERGVRRQRDGDARNMADDLDPAKRATENTTTSNIQRKAISRLAITHAPVETFFVWLVDVHELDSRELCDLSW